MSEFNPLVQPTVHTEPPKGAPVVIGQHLSRDEQVWLHVLTAAIHHYGIDQAVALANTALKDFNEKFGMPGCISNGTRVK